MRTSPPHTLVLACGALAREMLDVVELNDLAMTVECLPAWYHNRPEHIVDALRERVERARSQNTYDRILVGYADCGTGGRLDTFCEEEGLTRLPGAHCYEFFAGHETFAALSDRDPGTFYLTDYLVTHFDRLIWEGLGIADHPELFDMYFAHYNHIVYLSQVENSEKIAAAEAIAERMRLRFEHLPTGYGLMQDVMVAFTRKAEAV